MIYKRTKEICPTCNGWFWGKIIGKWVMQRNTVNGICQTCRYDYFNDRYVG
jgi:hypothetical protein